MAARRSTDPIKAAARRSRSQRRVGQGAACTQCGESRPEALVSRSRPRLCQECYQRKQGMKTTHRHHPAGRANSPLTVEVPANKHRVLSEAQYEWPPRTLQNPDGAPLLTIAAALRGAADLIEELVVRWIRSCAEMLEKLDAWLRERHGKWWEGSPFEAWQPE